MTSDVIESAGARYGPPPNPFAARAASLRSKLEEVARLLDADEIAAARAVLDALIRGTGDD